MDLLALLDLISELGRKKGKSPSLRKIAVQLLTTLPKSNTLSTTRCHSSGSACSNPWVAMTGKTQHTAWRITITSTLKGVSISLCMTPLKGQAKRKRISLTWEN